MRVFKKGDKVVVEIGKFAGHAGTVSEVDVNGRVVVSMPNISYERAYFPTEISFKGRSEEYQTSGESRRRKLQKLVREGKVCPSYPHACTGECGVEVE